MLFVSIGVGVAALVCIGLLMVYVKDRKRRRRIHVMMGGRPEDPVPDWATLERRVRFQKNGSLTGTMEGEWFYRSQHMTLDTIIHELLHELKQPLTVIQGYIQLLSRRFAGDEELTGDLTAVEQQLRRLMDFIQRMKTLQRPLTGHPAPTRVVPVREAVDPVVRLVKPLLDRRGVELILEYEPLSHARVPGDPFQQVVWNLITNAMEAIEPEQSTEREPCIRVRLSHFDPVMVGLDRMDGIRCGVTLVVEDNGRGFESASPDDLFQAFYTTKGGQHMGIGLAICKRLVEAQGGKIELVSRMGQGTRVTVWWPCAEEVQSGAP